ncbi:MAG: hypothetical protein ACE5O2_07245 [Armatimonadota bacterium]
MPTPCSFRYIEKGRTFCRIAIVERKYCTDQVEPHVCQQCRVPRILADHPCQHMDLGVEIDEYEGRKSVESFFASCAVFVERIMDLDGCAEGKCPHFKRRTSDEAAAEAAGEE